MVVDVEPHEEPLVVVIVAVHVAAAAPIEVDAVEEMLTAVEEEATLTVAEEEEVTLTVVEEEEVTLTVADEEEATLTVVDEADLIEAEVVEEAVGEEDRREFTSKLSALWFMVIFVRLS